MASHKYVVTAKAEADLVDIARYTRRQWGEKQRDKYIHELFELFARIAEQPQLGRHRDDIRPNLKSRQHKKTHIVFYRISENQIEILRVLHIRQDIQQAFEE